MEKHDGDRRIPNKAENSERRNEPRFSSRLKVHFYIKDGKDDRWASVYTKDISLSGLSFIYREFLPLSSNLKIKIPFARLREGINLEAKIMRMEDLGLRGYLYGIEYESIDSKLQEIIKKKIESINLDTLLRIVAEKGASELHLCVDTPPILRIGGSLEHFKMEPLKKEDLEDILYNILSERETEELINNFELDSSYELDDKERFRFNIHFQRGQMEATFRRIHAEHKSLKELGLPDIVNEFALSNSGLVVITGRTNNGKTTTAAAMIDLVNETKNAVIVTVEDPIEHIQTNKKSVIKQREAGLDTKSFAVAAREALRQDIDVLFIGEILNPETLLVALRAAEVGHLVIVTLPAQDSAQAIERMIFSVQPHLQYQVRIQLSNTLLGIISQKLYTFLPDPQKRIVAAEILINTSAIANAIREANISAIRTSIQTGAESGMQTMRYSVERLCARRLISSESIKQLEIEERSPAR